RLDEDGGHLVGRGRPLEHRLLDVADAGTAGDVVAGGAAARVGDVVNVRHQRREAAAVDQLGAGQRHGAVGPAVEGADEGDGARPAGVPAGELEGGLEGLGAAVGEEDAFGAAARGDLAQALGEIDLRLVVEIGTGHVQQLRRLVLDGGDDVRVAVAGGGDGD